MNLVNRFGLDGGNKSYLPTNYYKDLDRSWSYSYKYEHLELSDGSIFFDSIFADHLSISKPSPRVSLILRKIVEEPRSFRDLSKITGISASDICKILEPLVERGIIIPNPELLVEDSPYGLEFFRRHRTLLEWLDINSSINESSFKKIKLLQESRVTIIGQGGVGSFVAQGLAASGVGNIHIIDGDRIEESNLVRQIFYKYSDVGTRKVDSMRKSIESLTPYCNVTVTDKYIKSESDITHLVGETDIIVLCADAPRFLINKWIDKFCKENNIPYISTLAGLVGPFYQPNNPGCFNCMELTFMKELGDKYEMIVEALSNKKVWNYPSFVAGPMVISGLIVTEIVCFLSGISKSKLTNGILMIKHPNVKYEEFQDLCEYCKKNSEG